MDTLKELHRSDVILVGIETHVCVYQTVRDLKLRGYATHVLTDAVSSKTQENKDIALARMRQEGSVITSFEMLICELLRTADHVKFREVMQHVKR